MDLYCVKCGEPWDNDCLHEVAEEQGTTYAKVAADFRRRGCAALSGAIYGTQSCEAQPGADLRSMVYDLMGDDMDGAMSAFDDAEWLGLM